MNWHETIEYIREKPEYAYLVEKSYFEKDLMLNVKRFGESQEFKEVVSLIKKYTPTAQSLLEIGGGNGIAAVNFALQGFNVTVVEPDPSDTVGTNAILKLKEQLNLLNLTIIQSTAEELDASSSSFDVVYIRQAMHHANDLKKFVATAAGLLKDNGFFITTRDHVVFDEEDKQWFLKEHPLHKFYGGENAYSAEEYREALQYAGLKIVKEIKYFESPINYFPFTSQDIFNQIESIRLQNTFNRIVRKVRKILGMPKTFNQESDVLHIELLSERNISGRMYSYVAQKLQ